MLIIRICASTSNTLEEKTSLSACSERWVRYRPSLVNNERTYLNRQLTVHETLNFQLQKAVQFKRAGYLFNRKTEVYSFNNHGYAKVTYTWIERYKWLYSPLYCKTTERWSKNSIFVTRNENENVIILNMRHFPKYYDHFWSLAFVKLKLKMGNSCFFFIIKLVNMRERETLIWSFKSPVKVRCYFKTAYFSGETVSQKKTKTWIGKAREVKPHGSLGFIFLIILSF